MADYQARQMRYNRAC